MSQLIVTAPLPDPRNDPELTYVNVAIALAFILVDGAPPQRTPALTGSHLLHHPRPRTRKVPPRSLTAMSHSTLPHGPPSPRRLLTGKGLVLDSVFQSRNPFLIFGLVFLLIFLGSSEAVYNRSKKRFDGMVRPPPILLPLFTPTPMRTPFRELS
jgi:hypothetical protein